MMTNTTIHGSDAVKPRKQAVRPDSVMKVKMMRWRPKRIANSLPDTLITGPSMLMMAASVAALSSIGASAGCSEAQNTRKATIQPRWPNSS